MIQVSDLVVRYGQGKGAVEAVRDVSFSVEPGKTLVLVGPSGCGKTTILFALAGLLQASEGAISIAGTPVAGTRRDVALILQNAGLLPWKTVWQNANLSLLLSGEYRRKNASEVLEKLGLDQVKNRYPSELSEGMKRRVGVARALSTSPTVMLMDEPMASLDTLTKESVQDLILSLWQELRFSIVLVTHDIEEAAFLGQEILVLTERPARIKARVENPGMGSVAYRWSDRFFATTAALREALEK
ncbi:MAG: ABC transporter ATP-binding protein [Candidatus Bipolaricaulota bacterium]|nr:ABC transporter ATP-binding protein [Candidatus Bipolaricaulota bacterium]